MITHRNLNVGDEVQCTDYPGQTFKYEGYLATDTSQLAIRFVGGSRDGQCVWANNRKVNLAGQGSR